MSIYLDSAATTPPDPAVTAVVARTLRDVGANAASSHRAGVAAAAVVERARLRLAGTLGVAPDSVVFTSGGTEANNLALKGVAFARRDGGRHLVTSAIEHPSVREAARWLGTVGFAWTAVPVDREGFVDPDDLARALRPDTFLVSIVHGNHEIGTVQPLAALAAVCRARGVPLHVDACQSFLRAPLPLGDGGPDLVSLNAHKIHGPKGVGALLVRPGLTLAPLLHGGGQEGGLRSGTVNVPGVAGFAAAVECAPPDEPATVAALRDRFVAAVRAGAVPDVRVNGPDRGAGLDRRLPHIASLTLPGRSAKRVMQGLTERGVHVSTGSACSATRTTPSHVLLAIGLDARAAAETLRVSFGRGLTPEEVDSAAAALGEVAAAVREREGA
jgi:cysteine desulfurase